MPPTNNSGNKCVERRHIPAAPFKTYDAMVAMCKSKEGYKPGDQLIFYGSAFKLANMNDRSAAQEREALDSLEKIGWIIRLNAPDKRRTFKGKLSTDEYRVLEHAEFVAKYPASCPALRYNPETGAKLTPGRATRELERVNVRRIPDPSGLMASLPDGLVDAVADSIYQRRTSSGNPEQVPVQENQNACSGNPEQDLFRKTGQPVQETLNSTYSGNPEQSLYPKPEPEPEPPAPAKIQKTKTPVPKEKMDGWLASIFSDMGAPNARERMEIEQIASRHGIKVLRLAVKCFAERPQGLTELKYPWAMFLKDSVIHVAGGLAKKKEEESSDTWRTAHEPGYKEKQHAWLLQQRDEEEKKIKEFNIKNGLAPAFEPDSKESLEALRELGLIE